MGEVCIYKDSTAFTLDRNSILSYIMMAYKCSKMSAANDHTDHAVMTA